MAKKNQSQTRGKGESKTDDRPKMAPRDSVREMIESVVIAFVLAFLFRTFEAEAFVIPTGSMAPTLMGQHKDLICANCEYPYRVSASEEESRNDRPPQIVTASICPICRYQMDFGPGGPDEWVRHSTFKGDRILVAKFPYEFSDPERWDVAVFKNPSKAKENYIKRVVGVPNETVVICHGDIHTTKEDLGYGPLSAADFASLQDERTPEGEPVLRIERKPPSKVKAMLQVVHDNDYLPRGMPLRWEPQTPGWQPIDEGKGFVFDGKTKGDAMIGYNHLLPSPAIWQRIKDNPHLKLSTEDVEAKLITDFYAYNTSMSRARVQPDEDVLGSNWVGDLAVDFRVEIRDRKGEVICQLVEGGVVFQCRIDVAEGKATFLIPHAAGAPREAQTVVRGPGSYRIRFANVDDQLLLWVDGKRVLIDGEYDSLRNFVPTEDDLMPARIGTNGVAARFDELRILRDVYYISPAATAASAGRDARFFADPRAWKEIGDETANVFTLSADRFMVCGDNSPRSLDSRLWTGIDEETRETEYYVKRELLIGKAVYIYWPHTLPIPGLPDKWWFQLVPNVPRMGFVR